MKVTAISKEVVMILILCVHHMRLYPRIHQKNQMRLQRFQVLHRFYMVGFVVEVAVREGDMEE